jgi:hypothetical protein
VGPTGGRTWWAHFEFTRINIEPTIQKNEIEENLDILDVGHFLDVLDGMLPRRLARQSQDIPNHSGSASTWQIWWAQWWALHTTKALAELLP